MNTNLMKYSVNNLLQRKRRSFLTVLSIFIGIMAIFALVAFGQGLSQYIDQLAAEQGADKIIIQPKSGFGPMAVEDTDKFTREDIDFVGHINGVQSVAGSIFESVQVQRKEGGDSMYPYIVSIPDDNEEKRLILETFTVKLMKGRLLEEGDKAKVMLGSDYTVPDRIFDKPIDVGNKIYVNGHQMEVIGFFKPIGNPQDDMQVYVSEDGMIDVLGFEELYGWVMAQAATNVEPGPLADKIQERLRRHLDQEEGKETFAVETFEDFIATFTSIIDTLNIVIVLIALISVLVAAVNIVNTMYTAVLERTNEIGIMKAIGAENKEIAFIFLFEAGLLGLLGAGVGMVLGYGIAEMGGFIAAQAGYGALAPAYPLWLILGCLVFGIVIGAGSGLLPSLQAARQNPVQALRYE